MLNPVQLKKGTGFFVFYYPLDFLGNIKQIWFKMCFILSLYDVKKYVI